MANVTSSPPSAATKISESEFLQLQAEKARRQIASSLKNAQTAFTKSADPRKPIRRHPLIAIGSAALAGFVATAAVIPSKEESELRKMERIRRALTPEPPEAPKPANGSSNKPAEKTFLAIILKELIQIIRPILMAAITASIKAGANPPASVPDGSPPPTAQGPDKSF